MLPNILFIIGVFIVGFAVGGNVAYRRWVKTCWNPSISDVEYEGRKYRAINIGE